MKSGIGWSFFALVILYLLNTYCWYNASSFRSILIFFIFGMLSGGWAVLFLTTFFTGPMCTLLASTFFSTGSCNYASDRSCCTEDTSGTGIVIGEASYMGSRMSADLGSFESVLKQGTDASCCTGNFVLLLCLAGWGVLSKVGPPETGCCKSGGPKAISSFHKFPCGLSIHVEPFVVFSSLFEQTTRRTIIKFQCKPFQRSNCTL